MPIAAILALAPEAISLSQTLIGIVKNAIAAGRATTTAEEDAQLKTALASLGTAHAAFASQFADVLPASA